MNEAPLSPKSGTALDIHLRPEAVGDETFLFQVYASTREEELALTNWDGPTRAAFLNHQFTAMRRGYKSMFPDGEFMVVLNGGRPVGRIVVARDAKNIRLVDMALLPDSRGKKIGSLLLQRLQREAVEAKIPITLQVFQDNRALRFYQRLGFQITKQEGPYFHMLWQPSSGHSNSPNS